MDAESLICAACIDDPVLKGETVAFGSDGMCASCGRHGQAVTLHYLAERVDPVYREYYEPGPYRTYFDPAAQDGDPPDHILQEIMGIEPDIAEALVEMLHDDEAYGVAKHLEAALYDPDSRYQHIDTHPYELHDIWQHFSDRIRHHARYLDSTTRELLDELLGDLTEYSSKAGLDFTVTLDPDSEDCPEIYRARTAAFGPELRRMLEEPQKQLGIPPLRMSRAGRMNPPGIQVFYGAFSDSTCVSEVRPPVGSFVVVGLFRPLTPLRLLDLSAVTRQAPEVSIFASDYETVLRRWRFLVDFHALVGQPVQPQDELLEYVPTQAVAEYISTVLGFHGVIYASQQAPEDDEAPVPRRTENVALLGPVEIRVRCDSPVQPEGSGAIELPRASPGLPLRIGSFFLPQPDVPTEPSLPAPIATLEFDPLRLRVYRIRGVKYDPELVYLRPESLPMF